MEDYIAKCPICGRTMDQVKTICNGAEVLEVICRCSNCNKEYNAIFDKFYTIDEPDLVPLDFDSQGMDEDGFDRDGFNSEGYNSRKFDRSHIHKETRTPYDKDGYDWEFYDSEGFDRRGFDRAGFYKNTGLRFNPEGYDCRGYDRKGYNKYGVDKYGYDSEGYNLSGYNKYGKDRDGHTAQEKAQRKMKKYFVTAIIVLILIASVRQACAAMML